MKIIRRIVLAVILVIVIVVIAIILNLDRVVKRTVESQASSSLNLKTTLNSASLSLLGGKLNLHQLDIASPQDFPAPHMLELGDTNVAVSYGQLRQEPVHVESLVLKKPKLVIEQQGGILNFKKAMDQMPPSESSAEKKPLKLVIDDLKVEDADVVVRPGAGIPGVPQEITVPVPSLELKNVGTGEGSQNGAAVKDVVMQVVTALAAKASESGSIPAELKALLHANLGDVLNKLGGEAQKRIAAALPGELGQKLSEAMKDPQAVLKNAGQLVPQNIGNLLGNRNPATTQPSDTAGQAVQQLEGLLGGKKKQKQ